MLEINDSYEMTEEKISYLKKTNFDLLIFAGKRSVLHIDL